jgi:DNA replication and repair protein RecF
VRVNNETIHRVSLLAEKTPVRIINADSLDLILGSPGIKREYLDWYLFHVEHDYLQLWSKHKHALKQRNALLKQRKHLSQLDYWDDLIVQYCQEIYKLRSQHLSNINSNLQEEFKNLIDDLDIDLKFIPGWDIEKPLIELLQMKRSVDIKYGFTSYGSHRDDIRLSVKGLNAKQVLSRGQIKKISIVLLLVQISLLIKTTNSKVILLLDDLSSELDRDSINLIMKKIVEIDLQLFISNIEMTKDLINQFQEYKLFHVEHGMIKAVKNR